MKNFIKKKLKETSIYRKFYLARLLKKRLDKILIPKRLFFEPINICNYSCYKCLYPEMKRVKCEVDLQKYTNFLTNWNKDYGHFSVIEFTGAGEVLISKKFTKLVELTSKIMPRTTLVTTSNLSILTEEIAIELLNAGLRSWQVSLDSVNNAEYSKIVGTDKFDVNLIINNIKMLWELMKRDDNAGNKLVVTAHRPFDENYKEEMNKIVKRVELFCHKITKAPYQTLNSRKNGVDFELSEHGLYNNKYKLPCDYLWTDLAVVSDGSVRVCCSDMFDSPVDFGNVFKETPLSIINNINRRNYQKKMLKGDWETLYLCNKCHSPRA